MSRIKNAITNDNGYINMSTPVQIKSRAPNVVHVSSFHNFPHDGGAVEPSWHGPEVEGDRYLILNPHWNRAIAESRERLNAAARYLETLYPCTCVSIHWDEKLDLFTFSTLNF